MSDEMTEQEHQNFHSIMWMWMVTAEPKYEKGAAEHRGEGTLWGMSDEELDKAIQEEITDLLVYYGEKMRRKYEASHG